MTSNQEILDRIRQVMSEEGEAPAAPSESVITIQTSGGGSFRLPTEESMTIRDAIGKSGLTVNPAGLELWVNGSLVGWDFEVAPGSIVTAVGSVKGG